jgi:acyl carrier protein
VSSPELAARLKRLVVETLKLEGLAPTSLGDDQPLFGGGLGLDSIDALELVVAIEREFGVAVPDGKVDPEVFRTIRTLAAWLERQPGSRTEPGSEGAPVAPTEASSGSG